MNTRCVYCGQPAPREREPLELDPDLDLTPLGRSKVIVVSEQPRRELTVDIVEGEWSTPGVGDTVELTLFEQVQDSIGRYHMVPLPWSLQEEDVVRKDATDIQRADAIVNAARVLYRALIVSLNAVQKGPSWSTSR